MMFSANTVRSLMSWRYRAISSCHCDDLTSKWLYCTFWICCSDFKKLSSISFSDFRIIPPCAPENLGSMYSPSAYSSCFPSLRSSGSPMNCPTFWMGSMCCCADSLDKSVYLCNKPSLHSNKALGRANWSLSWHISQRSMHLCENASQDAMTELSSSQCPYSQICKYKSLKFLIRSLQSKSFLMLQSASFSKMSTKDKCCEHALTIAFASLLKRLDKFVYCE